MVLVVSRDTKEIPKLSQIFLEHRKKYQGSLDGLGYIIWFVSGKSAGNYLHGFRFYRINSSDLPPAGAGIVFDAHSLPVLLFLQY